MYTFLLYNERDMSPIRYTKNINERASLVNAIRQIQEKCSAPGHYRIQFATCSCKVVDRKERRKLMKDHRQKQDYKAMEPSKKNFFLRNYKLGI